MAEYTQNYNLKKPAEEDFYNVEDFNDNADIIDEKLKEIEDEIENIVAPVTSVNEKTGDVVLTAEDVGALPKTGGTMTGILTAQSNTSYTVRQVRNIILSTADADVGAMQDGDIWIKYK